ncbi:MAG: hypothetical protein ACE5FU_02580 [Nitrospinota bacterium]
MVKINLLKTHHGICRKFFEEKRKKSGGKNLLVRLSLLVCVSLLLVLGFGVIKKRVFVFLKAIDEQHEGQIEIDPQSASGTLGEKIVLPAPVSQKVAAGSRPENADNEKNAIEKPGIKLAPGETQEERSEIRVATTIIKENALLVKRKLGKAGFPASVIKSEATMPFSRLRYKNISVKQLETVFHVFQKNKVEYTSEEAGNKHNVQSGKIFLPLTLRGITSALTKNGIKGKKERGKSKVTVFKVFINGFFGRQELEQKLSSLRANGFSPLAVPVKEK